MASLMLSIFLIFLVLFFVCITVYLLEKVLSCQLGSDTTLRGAAILFKNLEQKEATKGTKLAPTFSTAAKYTSSLASCSGYPQHKKQWKK